MKIRPNILWRVPVFCLAASWLSFQITIRMGWFYVVKTTGPDGVTNVSADPVRSTIFDVALFLLVLFIGGLWFSRSMTRSEIAASASIIVAFYLIVTVLELILSPNFPVALGLTLAKFFEWTSTISSPLYQATQQLELSTIVSNFAPFLFVPFGKKAVKQAFA